MNQFVFEGDVSLEYSAGDANREICITEPGDNQSQSLEDYIASQLGFPSSAEVDAMLQKVRAQRAAMYCNYNPGETGATREGVRLQVTVEVLRSPFVIG